MEFRFTVDFSGTEPFRIAGDGCIVYQLWITIVDDYQFYGVIRKQNDPVLILAYMVNMQLPSTVVSENLVLVFLPVFKLRLQVEYSHCMCDMGIKN